VLERFSSGEKDVLLGTQMVAKGHHYPNVTLIGVLSAERGLCFPDFRAAEKTFRLLFQAAGRTGRGEKGGTVLIQTLAPEHFIFRRVVAHDYGGFAEEELAMRRTLGYPPAGRLMLFTVSGRSREPAESAAAKVAAALERTLGTAGAAVLGPTPALVERLRGRHRFQVLVRGAFAPDAPAAMVKAARGSLAGAKQIDLQWDVDPIELA
jgi:primosomal protein N' (replication factor Y)